MAAAHQREMANSRLLVAAEEILPAAERVDPYCVDYGARIPDACFACRIGRRCSFRCVSLLFPRIRSRDRCRWILFPTDPTDPRTSCDSATSSRSELSDLDRFHRWRHRQIGRRRAARLGRVGPRLWSSRLSGASPRWTRRMRRRKRRRRKSNRENGRDRRLDLGSRNRSRRSIRRTNSR